MAYSTKWLVSGIALIAIIGILLFIESEPKLSFGGNKVVPSDTTVKKEIPSGATFSALLRASGIATNTTEALLAAALPVYDVATIKAGKTLDLIFDSTSQNFKGLRYDINTEEQLVIASETSSSSWLAEKIPIEYKVERSSVTGVIEKSLYQTMVDQQIDERLAIELAEVFAWQIDFAGEIQKGDSFKVIYEKRYRDGEYAMPGKIITAAFTNNGEVYQGFYFQGETTEAGYYDENGKSLQKVFLKSPLQYKYISSGYTTRRFNPILNKYTAHRGIDYAANTGTPAVSVGDGTISQAGWNGDYGLSVTVRHNETYSTVYGHFSSLAKGIKRGAKVTQGQVVGYVGSTGLSTGPHLHYEMHKFGSFINPFTEKIPEGKAVAEVDRSQFNSVKNIWLPELVRL